MTSFATRAIAAMQQTGSAHAAADAIMCRNLNTKPLEGDYQGQDFATGLEGAQPEDLFNVHAGADFEVEAAAGGAAGTAPVYNHLLKSCGLTETISAGVSASYSPTPSSGSFGEEKMLIRTGIYNSVIENARGALSFTAENGKMPFFGLNMIGKITSTITDPGTWDPDFSAWRRALECNPVNMSAFSFGGQELCVRSFSVQDGRTPKFGKFMNCAGTDIITRRFTGRMTIEFPTRADLDILTDIKAGVTDALIFQLGTVAGDIVKVTGPKVQMKWAGEQDIDGALGVNLDLVFAVDQGDDEIAFTFL